MQNLELTIPQFYDIAESEIVASRKLYNTFLYIAKPYGYREIRTALVRDYKYLAATKVHYSKIFEVHRPRQHSVYLLQSDLAMSMSEYVSRIKFPRVLKLMQIGTLLRDRVDNIPGYRREFQQILSGVWGSKNLYFDAELIYLNYCVLQKLDCYESINIQLSNLNALNALASGLAEKLRFEGLSAFKEIDDCVLDDVSLIEEAFNLDEFNVEYLYGLISKIKSINVQKELERLLIVYKALLEIFEGQHPRINFSISNVSGTGHYTGMHYRIYGDGVLIVDGGRIDDMCHRFNQSKNIPGVCMGLGVQIAITHLDVEQPMECTLLVSPLDFESNRSGFLMAQKQLLEAGYCCSIIPIDRKHWGDVFTSEYYDKNIFVVCFPNDVQIRNCSEEQKVFILGLVENCLTRN